ncbi:MAG: hypothetical protein CMG46_04155 [Candidatus Marinimicrobia bacterium]|nr:hypothetical protein [Candidatus Neomarinimicrobiota bacterium]
MTNFNRRRVLRGMLNGGAVTVALPLLNCFLNSNGTALANGTPLPIRFGTWAWGLGMNKDIFVPKKVGADFDLPEEISMLAPIRQHINLFTSFNGFRDSAPNLCHKTGWIISRSGMAPMNQDDLPGETIDVTIAKKIGGTTRYQTLTATATGDVRDSFSYENVNSVNVADWSPIQFYTKLFGEDFQNPNASEFKPNPKVMVRKSVLSGVMESTKDLSSSIGAEDKQRLDQYLTGLRDLERQFDQQLTKPEPRPACVVGLGPKEDPKTGLDVNLVGERHKLMTDLMVMAVACDQTRVFNMAYSQSAAATSKVGYDKPHHTASHEEPVDEKLGYQPQTSWFIRRALDSWAYYVDAFSRFEEGDGSLLDNMLIYATTDQSLARVHSIDNQPMFTAGRAGGRVKTGLHVVGDGSPSTRLGLTAMEIFGLEVTSWGTQSNTASQRVGEILV